MSIDLLDFLDSMGEGWNLTEEYELMTHELWANLTGFLPSSLAEYGQEDEEARARAGPNALAGFAWQITFMSAFMLTGLVGNLTLLLHLIRIRGWRGPGILFVLSLSVSNILIALFSMSTEILGEAFGEWVFGDGACKAVTFVQCLLFVGTAFTVICMSYDRYRAVCRPSTAVSRSRSLARSRKMIALSWVSAAAVALPQIFIFLQVEHDAHPSTGQPRYRCHGRGYTAAWQHILYVTFLAGCVYLLPAVVAVFAYLNITIVLCRSTHREPRDPKTTTPGDKTVTLQRDTTQHSSSHGKMSLEEARIRSVKLTGCLVGCYLACWTPYFTSHLFNVWTDNTFHHSVPASLRIISNCLVWFSSCANPFVYALFHISCAAIFPRKKLSGARRMADSGLSRSPSVGGGGGCLTCSRQGSRSQLMVAAREHREGEEMRCPDGGDGRNNAVKIVLVAEVRIPVVVVDGGGAGTPADGEIWL